MFNSILVVCTGNICRSPLAERILRKSLPGKKIDSAGTNALVGHPADSSAEHVAQLNHLSLEGHKGQQFTSSLGRQYDLILVMERNHIEHISHLAPEARGKIMLFGHWLGEKEIPDPYKKSEEAFVSVFNIIQQSAEGWVSKLSI